MPGASTRRSERPLHPAVPRISRQDSKVAVGFSWAATATVWLGLYHRWRRTASFYHPATRQESPTLPRGRIWTKTRHSATDGMLQEKLQTNAIMKLTEAQPWGGASRRIFYAHRGVTTRAARQQCACFAMLRRQDLYRPLRIRYTGEEGIDSGGLRIGSSK